MSCGNDMAAAFGFLRGLFAGVGIGFFGSGLAWNDGVGAGWFMTDHLCQRELVSTIH